MLTAKTAGRLVRHGGSSLRLPPRAGQKRLLLETAIFVVVLSGTFWAFSRWCRSDDRSMIDAEDIRSAPALMR